MKKIFAVGLVLLLLAIDWLAFHDLFEPHTLRDWLTLVATIAVIIYIFISNQTTKRLA